MPLREGKRHVHFRFPVDTDGPAMPAIKSSPSPTSAGPEWEASSAGGSGSGSGGTESGDSGEGAGEADDAGLPAPRPPKKAKKRGPRDDDDAPKRKKASRACFHCQKAHLTCDDTRPCSRCLKRGLADSCTDGFRKKAKYLADVGDADLRADTPPPGARPPKPRPQAPLQHAPLLATSPPPLLQPQPHMANPSALQHPDPSLFSSDSINLEYAMLSNMLQQQGFPLPPAPAAVFPPAPAPARTTTPALPTQQAAHAAYQAVSRPYDYRQGFHHLVAYIKSRFQKDDIMRICRALAHFRPSFMAQIMNLSEEDLVFMEKCFQRTLVEYEKLINCSGTPTVVWRRTGEVALVGKEFSLLTGWGREGLVGKKTYIYELMDTASAVDYWEKFSLIAFDNSQQSVMTTCNLVTPQGRSVPCAFCFTIKRDIFDVPLAIVGAFLPSFDKMAAS